MGIIKKTDYNRIKKIIPVCEMAIKLCGTDGTISCMASYFVCNAIFSNIMLLAGDTNYYDIRKKCEGTLCYDFSNMEKFLNQRSVRDALGVGDLDFVSCSPTVYQPYRNLEVGIPALLEDGVKLLVYAGEYDLFCNWLGNSRWVHAMEWSCQKEFVASPETPFIVDGSEAEVLKSHGPVAFLKVHDAGHMVPMDQPKAALEMLKRWTRGKLPENPLHTPPTPTAAASVLGVAGNWCNKGAPVAAVFAGVAAGTAAVFAGVAVGTDAVLEAKELVLC
ncbi:serine carboxypeptidase 3-like [Malania oleifera]|uniref:serine carboxypeptidase 3-like n=1 Tax=Malania oleifera TaxID=397392 RepID=UPI0025ADE393|nr:serine carboxypeptidase 3-like [Malania oleifera]